MSDKLLISAPRLHGRRRCSRARRQSSALAQGFAGLGMTRDGFASVTARQDIRISRRSRSASGFSHRVVVRDRQSRRMPTGVAYGAQWTLFRQAMQPGAQQEGWANQQIWMGHAAVTRADTHRYSEALCARRRRTGRRRGNAVSCLDRFMGNARARSDARRHHRAARTQSIGRRISVTRCGSMPIGALVLQGEAGYSKKSERGQASYYFSQPYFKAAGSITIDDKPVGRHRTGLDGSRMEQSAACFGSNRMGLVFAASE